MSIVLSKDNPTDLWVTLGREFFSSSFHRGLIDQKLGDRRFVSINNTLEIKDWPRLWTGKALFELVGYSPKGFKMNVLRKTYVEERKWEELKERVKEINRKGFSSLGMNFNMSLERKGGCLSSLHLIRTRNENILYIHGKIAELPRKFVADLVLIRDLLQELDLWPMRVIFSYSVIYYSIVGLRAYVPVLGLENMDFHGLPIDTPRNYQAGIIEAINLKRKELSKRFKKDFKVEGLTDNLNFNKGEWYE